MFSAELKKAEQYARYLERRAKAIERATKKAASTGADYVVSSAKLRSKPRNKVTDQDHRSEVSPRPPRIAKKSLGGARMAVTMGGAWGHARFKAVSDVMEQEGFGEMLERKYLWVERPMLGGGVDQRQKLKFKDNPWLQAWAEREDRGTQALRHAVRLPPEVRMRLTLAPALHENQEHFYSLIKEAALRSIT